MTIDDGRVALGTTEVPGILESIEVRGQLLLQRLRSSGRSGSAKVPRGWDDADVMVRMTLATGELSCWDLLRAVSALFTASDKQGKPLIYTLVNRHVNARNIDQVLFTELSSSDTNRDDTVSVTLSFIEWRPKVVKRERTASAQAKADSAGLAALAATVPVIAAAIATGTLGQTDVDAIIKGGLETAGLSKSGRVKSTAADAGKVEDSDTPWSDG